MSGPRQPTVIDSRRGHTERSPERPPELALRPDHTVSPYPERVDQRRRISDVVLVSGEALRIHAEAADKQPADFYATQPHRARELRDQNRGRRR